MEFQPGEKALLNYRSNWYREVTIVRKVIERHWLFFKREAYVVEWKDRYGCWQAESFPAIKLSKLT